MLRRALRYFNIAVLLALAAALAAFYWFVWRARAQVSGTAGAPVSARVEVRRDALGVPHITARALEDALVAQGYVTAQDRLWQMDSLRRAAAGRLAEVLGPTLLDVDREARRFQMERIAERQEAGLPEADRALLAAYARGVNAFLATHRSRLPLEFTLLGYDPRPWRVRDSLLIGLFMYRNLSSTWRSEIQKANLLEGGDRAKVDFLFPDRLAGGVTPGSNAWALAGSRTASGRPVLANDPHLEYSLPGLWYAVHLQAPGLDVAGAALPGAPGVIIGRNQRIAWGVTALQFDVEDLYIERFDPQTGAYVFAGKIEQARLEREVIPVKGAPGVEFASWVTRHGPVFREGGRFLALRWAAAEPGFTYPILDLDRARNFQEFTAALARYAGPALNFVYAGADGDIGLQVAGRLPARRTWNGDVPVDGASGQYEWDGFIPFEQLPRVHNPASGLIVSANQNPFPADYPYRVSGNFASPYRAKQIGDMLAARGKWRSGEMVAVQKDVYSGFLHFLARQAVAAYDRRGVGGGKLADAARALRSWNGQMESGPAPLISTLVFQHLRKALAERASPGKGLEYDTPAPVGIGTVQAAPAAVETLLRKRPRDWFPDYDQLLLRAFLDAMEEGERMEGRNVREWDYARYNQLLIAHPVFGRAPRVGRYFNLGPAPQSGSPTSVKQTTQRLGPSMRMAVDLADSGDAWLTLLVGESGQIFSGHYDDQFEAWRYGRSLPMQFRKVDAESTLTIEPE
jgi:penicillin amidase